MVRLTISPSGDFFPIMVIPKQALSSRPESWNAKGPIFHVADVVVVAFCVLLSRCA